MVTFSRFPPFERSDFSLKSLRFLYSLLLKLIQPPGQQSDMYSLYLYKQGEEGEVERQKQKLKNELVQQ